MNDRPRMDFGGSGGCDSMVRRHSGWLPSLLGYNESAPEKRKGHVRWGKVTSVASERGKIPLERILVRNTRKDGDDDEW